MYLKRIAAPLMLVFVTGAMTSAFAQNSDDQKIQKELLAKLVVAPKVKENVVLAIAPKYQVPEIAPSPDMTQDQIDQINFSMKYSALKQACITQFKYYVKQTPKKWATFPKVSDYVQTDAYRGECLLSGVKANLSGASLLASYPGIVSIFAGSVGTAE